MKVIKIVPGREPEMVDIDNTLKALQQAVGGYIETVTLPRTGLVVIVNEEGRLLDLPENGVLNIGPLMGQLLVGTVLVVRAAPGAEDFSGVRACDLGLIRACWVPAKGEKRMKICERKKPAELWNAAACMGYTAIAMRRLGFELATVWNVVAEMHSCMDEIAIEDAATQPIIRNLGGEQR